MNPRMQSNLKRDSTVALIAAIATKEQIPDQAVEKGKLARPSRGQGPDKAEQEGSAAPNSTQTR